MYQLHTRRQHLETNIYMQQHQLRIKILIKATAAHGI